MPVAVGLLVLLGPPFSATAAELPEPASDESILFLDVPSVVGASSYEQRATEAPASVTVITAEEIATYGYRTLADILRGVRGFQATYDRNYTYIGSRGFSRPGDYNSRVLLLIDGHRINENVFDGAYVGTESLVDVELIDRVEVIRGPSSSLYGTSAFFGVVNVITKKGRDLAGAEVALGGASYSSWSARGTWGSRAPTGVESLVSGTTYRSGGQDLFYQEFDSPSTDNGWAVGLDDDRRDNLLAKISWGKYTVQASYNNRVKQVPTAAWGVLFNDPRFRTTDRGGYLSLGYANTFSDSSRIEAALSYDRYQYEGTYPYDYGLFADYGRGQWWTAEGRHYRSLSERHKLVLGASYRFNAQQDQGFLDVEPYNPYFIDERTSSNWSVFVQDEARLGRKWLINAGLRLDDYESFGGTVNPRLAVMYRPNDASALKFLYGTAFRAPNVYELYYRDGVTGKDNPDLEPETIRTYELVYEQLVGRNVWTTFSIYHYELDDLIEQVIDPGDGLLVFQNAGRVNANGVEAEASGAIGSRLRGRVSYTYQRAVDDANGEQLANSPKHMAKLALNAPLLRQMLWAGFEVQLASSRTNARDERVPGHTLTNLSLVARDWAPGLEFNAGIYNVLDRSYDDPSSQEHMQSSIPQDGRNFRLGVRYAF